MLFPNELTFGVFDAAAMECAIPTPILWLWQVHAKAGKLFASLMDGGSTLNTDNSTCRFLMRSMTPLDESVQHVIPQRGDVVQLHDYKWRRVVGKPEIIFMISKMTVLRHCESQLLLLPRNAVVPYPYDKAHERLHDNNINEEVNNTLTSKNNGIHTHQVPHQTIPINQTASMPPHSDTLYPNFNTQENTDLNKNHLSHLNASTAYAPVRRNVVLPTTESLPKVAQPPSINHPFIDSSRNGSRVAPYPPQYRQVGAIGRRIDGQFLDIKNLTSFLGRWIVKGRFINKGEPRTYSNSRGEGKIWNCDLVDSPEECGTIRCTFFNKAVDKFYTLITENHVYTVSKGTVRPVNKKFNSGAHPFELQLGEDADIQWVSDDDPKIPEKPITHITKISALSNITKQTLVSVCGIILHLSDISEIITRSTGQPRTKREMTIVDDSGVSIDITLWGTKASTIGAVSLNNPHESLIMIENARVDEFNGRRLSTVGHTQIIMNPDIPEAQHILRWYLLYKKDNSPSRFTSLTQTLWTQDSRLGDIVSISELRKRAVESPERDLEDRGCWFSCKATLINIEREKQFYWVACPNCGKKVMSPPQDMNLGDLIREDVLYPQNSASHPTYFCNHCNKEVENPIRKYLLNIEISDTTGSLKCNAMGDKGLCIMGNVTADTLSELQHKRHDSSIFQHYEDYFWQRLRKEYIFKIQAKSETYRDETRLRYRIFGLESINGVIENDPISAPNNQFICRQHLIKETNKMITSIYTKIPRITCQYMS